MAASLSERLRQRLERARRKLETAQRLLDIGDHEDAASRAYYAMYHAAHAALLPLKVAPKTHKGLSGMLSLHRIKTGHIDLELYRAFVAARDQREYGDYGLASIVGADAARATVEDARRFIDAVEELLHREGHLGDESTSGETAVSGTR